MTVKKLQVSLEHRGSRTSIPPAAKAKGVVPAVGHLHDPLTYLARQVRLRMDSRYRTVWCDERGRIFVGDSDRFVPPTAHSIIGRYDGRTRGDVIEMHLRAALRERASRWIVDWRVASK